VGLLIVFFHNERVPHWPTILAAHAVALPLVHGLLAAHARRPTNWLLALLRHFYPIILYTGLYCETGLLNQMFTRGYLDEFFMRLDEHLFGMQPSVVLMERLPYLVVSELLYAFYASYYVMIPGVGLALYFQSRHRFFHYITLVSFIFYVCYLIFIFLPVAGPPAFWMERNEFLAAHGLPLLRLEFPASVQRGLMFRVMGFIYHHFEAQGGAFPSSHVAVAICTLWFTWRFLPRIRYFHLVTVILLSVATVYCRYHYAVDVIGGAGAAALLIPIGERLYRRFSAGDAGAWPQAH